VIGSALRLCGMVLLAWIIVFCFAVVLGVPTWVAAVMLLSFAALALAFEPRPAKRDEPPSTLTQTGGYPKSRR
jgi:membrane protein implicated in regulation of membrane protease activity